jgi:hypothetical protein
MRVRGSRDVLGAARGYDAAMGKPLRWVGVSVLIGLVLGSVFGFLQAQATSCEVDGIGLPIDATCYRVFGFYLSTSVYYTLATGLIGMAVGLAIGLIVAIPLFLWRRDDREPTQHLLENPLVWLGLQVVELAIVVPALLF